MKKTIDDYNFNGKRTFLRCDFNVPLKDGKITNDLRIVNALPTIKKILADGGRLIIASHLGRPKGQRNESLSLRPIADYLANLLEQDVSLAPDSIGAEVETMAQNLENGQVLLLENVRFHAKETSKDINEINRFAKNYVNLAEVFVNDAFGTAHRAQASVVGLSNELESLSGYLLAKELEYFNKVLGENKEEPVVAILGGAKVSDKIQLIENMLAKVSKIIIGGAMAYTFQFAQGRDIGDSLVEKDKTDLALSLIKKAEKQGVKLILPIDTVIADDFSDKAQTKIISGNEDIPKGWEGIDVGPKSIELFKEELAGCKTVVWNGPLGVFEIEPFSHGTKGMAEELAKHPATVIIGGGDTVAAIYKFNKQDRVDHISTGGGSSLELLEGKQLPGVTSLTDK